jgi:hypothetical protein
MNADAGTSVLRSTRYHTRPVACSPLPVGSSAFSLVNDLSTRSPISHCLSFHVFLNKKHLAGEIINTPNYKRSVGEMPLNGK